MFLVVFLYRAKIFLDIINSIRIIFVIRKFHKRTFFNIAYIEYEYHDILQMEKIVMYQAFKRFD